MKYLRNFDYFCNPSSNYIDLGYYDYLDYNCLEYSSYVDYIYFETINGEIDSKPIPIYLKNLKDIIDNDVFIIAYNHLDNVAMEVKKFV